MRVLHLCNLPLHPEHPDFAKISFHPGRWVLNLALAQRAHADIDARLIMQVPGASEDFRTEIEGAPVHFVAAPDRFRSATLFMPDALRLRRAALAQNPDLIHAHGTEDAYALAAEACGKPFVITAQGCFFIINRELPPKLVSRERIVQFTEWLALKRAKHVIAKSSYVRDELSAKFPHLLLHEIPNTIDPRLVQIPFDCVRDEASIAFVGTLVPRKGVHVLCDALELLGNSDPGLFARLRLHIFGDRPEAASPYEKECTQRLVSLLGHRVVFHGTIPALQVADELSRIRVLVAPSLEEMFGNQFIEAVAVGCDAIVTEGTAMAENAQRLNAGRIVARGDAAALAGSIENALKGGLNDAARAERRSLLFDLVGPESVARRHAEVYRRVVQNC